MTASRTKAWKWIAAGLFSCAVLAFAPAALAEPTAQDKEHARDLMADGRDKRDHNDLPGALESFKQADAIMHVPTTGYEVAKTQQMLGKLLEARATVDAIAKLPASPNDPAPFGEARTKAEALGKELDKELAVLKIAAPPSAKVTIDDVPVTTTDVRVTPGKHVVVSTGSDEGDVRQEVTVAAGETKDVELHAAKPPPIDTRPEPPGRGFPIPPLSIVGFGVGVAGIAVGTVAGVMAISAESDLSTECPSSKCKPEHAGDLDSAKTKATISTVGFIVAGVGIAVGVVGFFLQPKTEANVGAVKIDFARLRATF